METFKYILAISLDRVVVPSPKIVIILPRNYEKEPLKENHIGSMVGEILCYTNKTLTDPVTLI